MRKTKILFMLTMCCLSLAACGQNRNTTSTTEVAPSTNPSSETSTAQNTTPSTSAETSTVVNPSVSSSSTTTTTSSQPVPALTNFTTKNLVMKKESSDTVVDEGTYTLLFKENSDIPYISLNDGVSILSKIRHERIDGDSGTNNGSSMLSVIDDNAVITNDNLGICTISAKEQTIHFDDFDVFSNINLPDEYPLMIANIGKGSTSLKVTKVEYTKGEAVTLDLKNYSKLDIVKASDKLYIPVALYSSIFLSSFNGIYLGYNFENLYLVNQGGLSSTNLEDNKELSKLGEAYYGGVKKETVSAEYALYTTQAICFDMDHFYGLKADKKYTSFYSFLETKGYLNDMLSGNVKKMDAALVYAIYDINDGHTFLSDYSPLYEFNKQEIDKTKLNKAKVDYETGNEALKKSKIDADADDNNILFESDKTMLISFSGFTATNEKIIYSGNKHNEYVYALCTAAQFSDAYKLAIEKKDVIKNIVVDLTTNDGGASDGMLYALSTLIGEVSFTIYDPLSKAHTTATYKADMDLDKVVDEKDVPLIDQGFNIIFLSSEYTFSSANAMVVGAKANNKNVITCGQTTGGGPCVVKHSATGIGTVYSSSGLNVISLKDGNTFKHIDGGQTADHAIAKDKFYDRAYICAQVKSWLNQ